MVFFVHTALTSSKDPIVGKYKGIAAVDSSKKVIPIITDTYISINSNNTFYMKLDESTDFNGTWKRDDANSFGSSFGAHYYFYFDNTTANVFLQNTASSYDSFDLVLLYEDIMIGFNK